MAIYKPGRPSQQKPPKAPGEYRIINKSSGKADYIGETNDLRRRKAEHQRKEKLNPQTQHFEWKKADGRSTSKTRREHEKTKIDRHGPPQNKTQGGEGRKAKRN